MQDERSASWKILLPEAHSRRTLAVGLESGAVLSLARSSERLECAGTREVMEAVESAMLDTDRVSCVERLEHCRGDYSLIVAAAPLGNEGLELKRLTHLLASNGTIACLDFGGCGKRAAVLRSLGLDSVEQYAVLPPQSPRLFFSTATGRLTAKGLGFHAPGSIRARWGLRLAGFAGRIGCRRHLHRLAITMASRHELKKRPGSLPSLISEHLAYPIEDLVVYAGSDSPRRKITALAVAPRDRADVVVKIADTKLGAEAIRQEADALLALSTSPLAPQVPTLIGERMEWGGYSLRIQSNVGSAHGNQVPVLTDQHFAFLSAMGRIGRRSLPLSETRVWQDTTSLIHSTGPSALPAPLHEAAIRLNSDSLIRRRVVCHRTHGDFAPWNMRTTSGSLFVLDWEDSRPDGLAFCDLLHFVYRQAAVVGPWPGPEGIWRRMLQSAERLRAITGDRRSGIPVAALVWMINEYLHQPSVLLKDALPHLLTRVDQLNAYA